MKLICVGHALKEVMTANECLQALKKGASKAGVSVDAEFLVSDGGDGFLEAYEGCAECTRHYVACTGPLGNEMAAAVVVDEKQHVAIIESALVSGLNLVEPERRNIMLSGTSGLGDLLAEAKTRGAKSVLIGLGGTATCDGGVGFLWRLAELTGQCVQCTHEPRVALDMADVASPEILEIRQWLGDMEITACVDVDNPLLGEEGAARTFAAQKGADKEQVEQLEAFMADWAQRVERNAGEEFRHLKGSGAAGGLGFALAAIGAKIESGGEAFCRWTGLEAKLEREALVITAEGKFDATSMHGKATWTVANKAREHGARVAIFCGVADEEAQALEEEQGVQVLEFGRALNPDARRQQSGEALADAVAGFLKTVQASAAS